MFEFNKKWLIFALDTNLIQEETAPDYCLNKAICLLHPVVTSPIPEYIIGISILNNWQNFHSDSLK